MSIVSTIRTSVKKVIVEGPKQYPEGMSRQEFNELKEEIEKELKMTDEVKEGWVMLGPVGGKGTHDFAGDKRQGYRTFTTDKSKFFKKKTTKLSGSSQPAGSSPADKKSRFEEEVEKLDEISTKAKLDYIRSASSATATHAMHKGMDIANRVSRGETEQSKSEKETSRKLMNRQSGIQRAARMLSKEETEIEEAIGNERIEVKKTELRNGHMLTVRHGSSHSYPLHPEHIAAIRDLKDGEQTKFKDETGNRVTAQREGDKVHLSGDEIRTGKTKTTVGYHHFAEEVEQVNELSKKTLGSYVKKAADDVSYNSFIAGGLKKDKSLPYDQKAFSRQKGIEKATDRLTKEEVENLEEMPSARALGKGSRNATVDAAYKSFVKRGGMKSYTPPGTMSKAALNILAAKAKAAGKGGKIEEGMLDEGRGRPPKEGSAAWHRAQAAKKGDEGETQEADKNIHTQLHKVISAKKPVTFNNGKTHEISSAHAHKALALLQNSKPSERLALQHSLSHSHDRFHETIKTGKAVVEPAKPKVSLAKRVAEAVDPSTTAADKKAMVVFKKRDKDGVLRVHKRSGGPSGKDIVDAMESTKAEDIAVTVKPKLDTTNMAADSMKKYEKDPLFSKIKFKLPPTQGNKPIGGEEQVHVGKFSMEESRILNKLYEDLSEDNKKIYEQILSTEDGKEQLIAFAVEQGY